MAKFKKGDTVEVISDCQSHGQVGTVLGYTGAYFTISTYVQVEFANGHTRNYSESSLKRVRNTTTGGCNTMLIGNYNVAMVKFVRGTNAVNGYAFALFDDDIAVNDMVLCDTSNGYNVAEVTEIIPKNEYEGTPVTKEIICKVDFTEFETRKENRQKAKKLKAEMDKKIKDMQEFTLYEMMAEKCPELREMLNTYKGLI